MRIDLYVIYKMKTIQWYFTFDYNFVKLYLFVLLLICLFVF